jgi:hypothetical protein
MAGLNSVFERRVRKSPMQSECRHRILLPLPLFAYLATGLRSSSLGFSSYASSVHRGSLSEIRPPITAFHKGA